MINLIFASVLVCSSASTTSRYNVEWLSPTPFDGKQYTDGMPAGNGEVVVLAWGNQTAGSIDFFVRSQRAQHTDETLFTIARLQVLLTPNPFSSGSYWNQTLDLESGQITVFGGGNSFDDYAASISLFVDSDSPTVAVSASSRDGTTLYNMTVLVHSVRPSTRLTYKLPFNCENSSSGPDEWLPDTSSAALQQQAIGLYHVNDVGSGDTPFFANTMKQQGLSDLLGQFKDPLDGRIFGLGVVGVSNSGDKLMRVNNASLASNEPASAFDVYVKVIVIPDAHGDREVWLAMLGLALALTDEITIEQMRMHTADSWSNFWERSYIDLSPTNQSQRTISQMYSLTRYVQALQSRTEVPIKFNGMLLMNQAGSNGPLDVDYRDWGPGNWWQNTRLPYGNMLAAGDADTMRTVLDWVLGFVPLAEARTALLLPNESGIFFTECVTSVGLYQQVDYGCSRDPNYPTWLESSGWIHLDFGGNGVGLEASLMVLDYYLHTGDVTAARLYLPFVVKVLDFYRTHYTNRTADGKYKIWPTQVLETYWCEWPGYDNCCQDDLPQIAGLHSVIKRLLQLPTSLGLLSPQERSLLEEMHARLPSVPLQPDGKQFAPAAVVSNGTHNAEIPELYGVHPFRLYTVGRAAVETSLQKEVKIGINTFYSRPLAQENEGWYYGVIDAALLGLSDDAFEKVSQRASVKPAPGYRFPAFAQHYQDYQPSADHFANLNTALQHMLLQLGEETYEVGKGIIVLLPAWPCHLDVSFKLWASWKTSVEVVYTNGKLEYLDVQPPERKADVKWANCVQQSFEQVVV